MKLSFGNRPFLISGSISDMVKGYLNHLEEDGGLEVDDVIIREIKIIADEKEVVMNPDSQVKISCSVPDAYDL